MMNAASLLRDCHSAACSQARELAADDRIAEADYLAALCPSHLEAHRLITASDLWRSEARSALITLHQLRELVPAL